MEDQQLKSSPTYQTSLNFQSVPPSDISVLNTSYETFWPVFNPSDTSVVEYFLPASSSHYTDLKDTFLYLRLKVTDKEGKALLTDSSTAPGNMIFSSLFNNVELLLNNVSISNNSNNYSYSAYLNRMLNSTKDDDESLKCEGYYKQTTNTAVDSSNNGYKSLLKLQQNGDIELYGRISHGIFDMDKMVPPGISIRIRLRLQPSVFCLLGNKPAAGNVFTDLCKISETYLDVKRHLVHSKKMQIHQNAWNKGMSYKFPYTDYDVITYTVGKGNLQHISEVLFHELPSFVLIGLVKTTSYTGEADESPFSFSDFNLSGVQLLLNGENILFPHLQTSKSNKHYMKVYRRLLNLKGKDGTPPNIDLNEFLNTGKFLIPLWYNNNKSDRYSIKKEGSV